MSFRFVGINDYEIFYLFREEREKLLIGIGVVEVVNCDNKKILIEF